MIYNDGKISEDLLYIGLNQILKNKPLKKDVKKDFRDIDTNNNKFIEYEELKKNSCR